ncbi:SWIM zinc finger domain-containing protein [Halobacteria archaeon AArc-curdl1]|uniref:SWIM zinc finger domain-containing protein n=1 Tax=Natronosalvus hydrolyticus TaxID=2979988 RepID=A0AAP2ZBF4_9EURY|nr:SWIM zinc finger domain-containing protein [Halobacteria archaeon AArc-curdl1]
MHTIASPKTSLSLPAGPSLPDRSRRARVEPMSVLALGGGLYEVETGDETTYLVDLEAGRCTCPDHAYRNARCKHVRRVAIEITEGRTPPPGQVSVPCFDCGEPAFIDETRAPTEEPAYCPGHRLRPGDRVRDRETDDELVVVGQSRRPANEVVIDAADTTVAAYPTNRRYSPTVPVVGAIYPHATIDATGPTPESLRVYVFPRTRLEKLRNPLGEYSLEL